jgi:hypothetical protein
MHIEKITERHELGRRRTDEHYQDAPSLHVKVGQFLASTLKKFREHHGYSHDIQREDVPLMLLGHDAHERTGAQTYERYAQSDEDQEIPFGD